MSKPLRLLVFVRPEGDNGPILSWDGPTELLDDLQMAGWDSSDHEMSCTDGVMWGLLIFEGWREVTAGPEPDIRLVGEWRRLTFWEVSRVRFGLVPWGASRKEERSDA